MIVQSPWAPFPAKSSSYGQPACLFGRPLSETLNADSGICVGTGTCCQMQWLQCSRSLP